jgi:hypothetical protein
MISAQKRDNATKDESDKLRDQAHQMFNIAEKPVMTFISELLEEDPSVIFNEEIPEFAEPLILLPFEDYKKDVCLKFTLKPLRLSDDENSRKQFIGDILLHEKVREGIGFLFHCVRNVYASVMGSSVINNKPLLNIKLDLDTKNFVFYPKFCHELTIKKEFFETSLGNLLEMKRNKDDIPKETMDEMDKEFHNLINCIADVDKNLSPEIKQMEERMNNSFKDSVKLGIFIDELHKKDLAKPKNINNDALPSITQNDDYSEMLK